MTMQDKEQAEMIALEKEYTATTTLLEISHGLNAATDEDEVLHVLAQAAQEAGANGADLSYIDLDQDGGPEWVEMVATWRREGASAMPVGTRLYLPEFPFSKLWMASPENPQLIADVTIDKQVDDHLRNMLVQSGISAMVVIPLTQAGRWVALVTFNWHEPHQFGEQEIEIYRALTGLAAPVVENRRLLARAQKALQEAALFRTMVENSLDGIFTTDLEARLTYGNQATHEMFGCDYQTQEMVGQSGTIYWPEEDLPFLTETVLPQALAGGWSGELRQKHKDGLVFDASAAIFPLYDANGQPAGIAVTVRDITEQKRLREEREQFQKEVIEAQKQALQELSTPIIPVMDRIIVMPLVGSIDTMRARDITRRLLAGIREQRAKIVILDITGVPIVDSGVADHLNKTIQAARLKGARTIVTGISDAVAETIVDLGIDWGDLETLSDLQTGLVVALDNLGVKLSQ